MICLISFERICHRAAYGLHKQLLNLGSSAHTRSSSSGGIYILELKVLWVGPSNAVVAYESTPRLIHCGSEAMKMYHIHIIRLVMALAFSGSLNHGTAWAVSSLEEIPTY